LNNTLESIPSRRRASNFSKRKITSAGRTLAPFFLALAATTAANAQGTIDMSGATSLMTTVKTFAEYAGAVICLISLIFAGVQLMSGNFARAIPALGGAIFGAGVLGWGAGWISSLTGQSISMIVSAHSQWLA
jgi:hypothetical protein